MASLFTRIIDGDIPGRFVWKDDRCVAFMTIAPIRPGHALVVPRDEVDHWLDLDAGVLAHLMVVSQTIGRAQQSAFSPARVGMIVAGMEVPHTHVHVIPIRDEGDLDFGRADPAVETEEIDRAAESIRRELRSAGHAEVADA